MLPLIALSGTIFAVVCAITSRNVPRGDPRDFFEIVGTIAGIVTAITLLVWGGMSANSAQDRTDCTKFGVDYAVETVFQQYDRGSWDCYVKMGDSLIQFDKYPLAGKD